MTLDQLIERALEQINTKLQARNGIADELKELRSADAPDEAKVEVLRSRKADTDAEIDALNQRVEQLRAEKVADEAFERLARQSAPEKERSQKPAYDQVLRTGQEPRTYTRDAANSGTSFFSDSYRMKFKDDYEARGRIERHMQEVKVEREFTERATTTGSFAGLVIPQYLPELAALVLRNGRPTANVVKHMQLPETGLNLVIQRGTTGASAAVQASENTAVSSTDEVWSDLTIPIRTISGQQDVSRQALERGYAIDELIYTDLVKAYAASLDVQVLNGSGASGQMLGILQTAGINTATAFGAVASPTNFNLKIAGQNSAIYSGGQGLGPDILVMHPRRWGWLSGQVDTTGRPIVSANAVANFNAFATGTIGGDALADAGTPIVGVHSSGLPVLLDLNIPNVGTNNEDVVLALDSDELILWEDGDGMPKQLSFEQTAGGALTTKLLVYGYAAFTAGRYPGAVGRTGGADAVAGNGLVAPTF